MLPAPDMDRWIFYKKTPIEGFWDRSQSQSTPVALTDEDVIKLFQRFFGPDFPF